MDVGKLIDKLAKEEEAFLKRNLLAPVVKGGNVCVRIRGIVCRFTPEDPEFQGWGVFRPVSLHKVKLLERAGKTLVRKYLDQLTSVEIILVDPGGSTRTGVIAHPAGSRVSVDGSVLVHLVEKGERFRHILARFDGLNFWFERVHPARNPAHAAYLRKSLDEDLEVEALHRPGLVPQEKRLYAELLKLERAQREDPERRRIRTALEHGGARLDSYHHRGGAYNVTFILDGVRHTSTIRSDDLSVISAGICLDGEDEKFDLQSLVGVLREARQMDHWD
jgi:hypothetical protein